MVEKLKNSSKHQHLLFDHINFNANREQNRQHTRTGLRIWCIQNKIQPRSRISSFRGDISGELSPLLLLLPPMMICIFTKLCAPSESCSTNRWGLEFVSLRKRDISLVIPLSLYSSVSVATYRRRLFIFHWTRICQHNLRNGAAIGDDVLFMIGMLRCEI